MYQPYHFRRHYIDIFIKHRDHEELINTLKSGGMSYLVNFPRVCTTIETGAIDHILTNISKKHIEIEGIITFCQSMMVKLQSY